MSINTTKEPKKGFMFRLLNRKQELKERKNALRQKMRQAVKANEGKKK